MLEPIGSDWTPPWDGLSYDELVVTDAATLFEQLLLTCLEHPLYLVRPPEQDATIGDDALHHIVERGFRGYCCKGYAWLDADDEIVWVLSSGVTHVPEGRFELADPRLIDKLRCHLRLLLLPRLEQKCVRLWYNEFYD